MVDVRKQSLSQEDELLAVALTKAIDHRFGAAKIAQVAQDIERIGVLWATPEHHVDADATLQKFADDETPSNDLRKALSSAWLSRARSAVSAVKSGGKKVLSRAKGALHAVDHTIGEAGGAVGEKVTHLTGGSPGIGRAIGTGLAQGSARGIALGTGINVALNAVAAHTGKKKGGEA